MGALRTELQKLLPPTQKLVLLPSTHDIHDHPQISVALMRASKADTQHGLIGPDGQPLPSAHPYVDAAGLAHELRHSVDWLASGLMERSSTPATAVQHLHEGWAKDGRGGVGDDGRRPRPLGCCPLHVL